MRCPQIFKKVILFFDLFATPKFLRYSEEPTYSTTTGGVFSIVIVALFASMFVNISLQTLRKELIFSSVSSLIEADPSLTTISTFPTGNFMFAVCIDGINLNKQRFFDVVAFRDTSSNFNSTFEMVELQPCTLAHFSMDQGSIRKFKALFYTCVCPPLNFNFSIQGSFSSNLLKTFDITIAACNSTGSINPLPCMEEEVLQNWEKEHESYVARLNIVNPLINPSVAKYLSYYIQERLFVTFSRTLGVYAYVDFEDFTITSDQSILPYTDNRIEIGVHVDPNCQTYRFEITNSTYLDYNTQYATFYYRKSPSTFAYIRSFNKVDNLLSYIGTIVSAVFTVAFFLKAYTDMALELQIGGKLYRANRRGQKNTNYIENQEDLSLSFNLLSYCSYGLYSICKKLGLSLNWKKMKDFEECQEETVKQMDVVFLFQRLNFLERFIDLSTEEWQSDGLHLLQRQSLKKASLKREAYDLKQKMVSFRQKQLQRRQSFIRHVDNLKGSQKKRRNSLKLVNHPENNCRVNGVTRQSISIERDFRQLMDIQERISQQAIQHFNSGSNLSADQGALDHATYLHIQEIIDKLELSAKEGSSMSKKILKQFALITHEIFSGDSGNNTAQKRNTVSNGKPNILQMIETSPAQFPTIQEIIL